MHTYLPLNFLCYGLQKGRLVFYDTGSTNLFFYAFFQLTSSRRSQYLSRSKMIYVSACIPLSRSWIGAAICLCVLLYRHLYPALVIFLVSQLTSRVITKNKYLLRFGFGGKVFLLSLDNMEKTTINSHTQSARSQVQSRDTIENIQLNNVGIVGRQIIYLD